MNLTGIQIEQLRDALCDAFDEKALEQMVQFKLGKDLFTFVPHGALQNVAFDLIMAAQREGWTEALVTASHISRPKNPAVLAFCRQHAPYALTPPTPDALVQQVSDSMQAVVDLARQPDNVTVHGIVRRFRAGLDAGRGKFKQLAKYKALHDCLHFLQFQYLAPLADAVARFRQDETQYRLLQRYVVQLQGQIEQARQHADDLPTEPTELDWVDDYARAAADLENGMPGNDDGPMQRAVESLRAVVRESPRINDRLASTARELPLDQLVEAMQEIACHYAGQPAVPAAAAACVVSLPADLRKGLDALRRLKPRLDGLIEEHFAWQWLDKELDLAEALPGHSVEDRFPRWAKVCDRIGKLADLSQEKPWAQQLAALCKSLTGPYPRDPAGAIQFERTLSKFRDVASERFFRVDDELRDLSSELLEIGRTLDLLLGVLIYGNA